MAIAGEGAGTGKRESAPNMHVALLSFSHIYHIELFNPLTVKQQWERPCICFEIELGLSSKPPCFIVLSIIHININKCKIPHFILYSPRCTGHLWNKRMRKLFSIPMKCLPILRRHYTLFLSISLRFFIRVSCSHGPDANISNLVWNHHCLLHKRLPVYIGSNCWCVCFFVAVVFFLLVQTIPLDRPILPFRSLRIESTA